MRNNLIVAGTLALYLCLAAPPVAPRETSQGQGDVPTSLSGLKEAQAEYLKVFTPPPCPPRYGHVLFWLYYWEGGAKFAINGPEARVELWKIPKPGTRGEPPFLTATMFTDRVGRVFFADVPEGYYQLRCYLPDGRPFPYGRYNPVTVSAGFTTVALWNAGSTP